MYTDLFENQRAVESAYEVALSDNIVILLAHYEYEDYSGYSYVLFYNKEDGKLYEVNAGHCSCHGLEGQWNPEETSIELLREKIKRGAYGDIKTHLKEIITGISNGILV